MPDYNLGRAHGTIKVDYDGRGVRQADDDLSRLGDTTEETSRKTTESVDRSKADYDGLAAAARRLEQEVSRAAGAEIAARARAAAAQQHLVQVQNDASASAQHLLDAQREATRETRRYEDAVLRARTANTALGDVQRRLASQRRPDLTPGVDTSKLSDIVHHLQNIEKSSRTSSGTLNTFRSRLFLIAAAGALASPSIASLAVAIASLTGLVGVAAGALAGLAAVGGTLATAFSGLGAVFKASSQQAASAGSSAAQTASQQRAAARQIEQAIRGVRDAEENLRSVRREAVRAAVQAAQQIVQAERQLRDAQFDALRAQETLNRARRDAARQLEDLRIQLIGGALDERQAIIDLQRAQEELNKTLADPRSSDVDRAQAVLNLEKQQQALENVRTSNQRLGEDSAVAAAKGVAGSDQVVDAQQAVIHANEAAGDAAVGVAEAVVAAAQQQIDGQLDVRNATESLLDAQRDLAEAYLQAAEAGASGGAKMADALANVSPEARKLATAILAQRDAWQDVKFAVQDALFAGLSKEVAPLANQWLPLLKKGMVGIATELRGVIVDLINFLHQGQTTADVGTIFENVRQAVHNVAPAVRALLQVFLNLATVGSSFLPGMAKGFADWATKLAEVSQRSRETGAMQQWMQTALATLGKVWELLKNLFTIIGLVFGAFSAEGGDALTSLINLTQAVEDFLKSAQGQEVLHALGKTLASLAKLFGTVLIGALHALAPAFVAIAPLIQQVADILGKQFLAVAVALAPVLKIIADVLSFLSPVLAPLIASMILLNKAVQVAAAVWRILNTVMKANIFLLIIAAVVAVATLIVLHWTEIKDFLIKAWELIRAKALEIWDRIKSAVIDPVANTVAAVIQFFKDLGDFIVAIFNAYIASIDVAGRTLKDKIITPVQEGIAAVIRFFQELPGKIAEFFSNAGQWLFSAGMDIINGLLEGINRVISRVWDTIRSIGRGISDAFSSVLSIFSPSKVFAELGVFTLQGYIVGLDKMEPQVIGRVIEIASSVESAGRVDALVPAGAVPAPRIAADASTSSGGSDARSIVVQTLNLHVAGNLDPTDRVKWRTAIKKIKKDIEAVDRSDEP